MFSCFKLEALEYISSSLSMLGTADQDNELGDRHDVLSSTLKPLPRKSSNWLSADVSVHLEFHVKLNLSLCYLSKLIREHPSWPDTFTEPDGEASYSEEYLILYVKSNENFKQKLYTGLDLLEQKFLLTPCHLISMVCFPIPILFLFCVCATVLYFPILRKILDFNYLAYSDHSLSISPYLCRFYSYFAIMDYGTLGMMLQMEAL